MPGLLQPWWLIALAAIPWIRWWHRRQASLSVHTVSAVFLWRTSSAGEAGAEPRPPDPAWRRRATIAGLMILALAGPYSEHEHAALTVWLDNSLSMQVVEAGDTRLASAEALLEQALDDGGYAEVTRRPLTAELPDRLEPDSAHWLVTDGADARLRDWAVALPFDRVITVGTETENVAVTRVAARRSLEDPSLADLLVAVSNTGTLPAERRLDILRGDDSVQTINLVLEPGQTRRWQTQVTTGPVTAVLDDGDALSLDDRLAVSGTALASRPADVEAGCGEALARAVAAHPGLDNAPNRRSKDLVITCGPELAPAAPGSARIHVVTGSAQPLASSPAWLPVATIDRPPTLRQEVLAASAWPADLDLRGARTLLRAGDEALVVLMKPDDEPATVATVIDLRRDAFARQPDYSAFIATLIDAALGEARLDAIDTAARDVQESIIRPAAVEVSSEPGVAGTRKVRQDLTTWLLVAALLILAIDIALLAGARRRAAHG